MAEVNGVRVGDKIRKLRVGQVIQMNECNRCEPREILGPTWGHTHPAQEYEADVGVMQDWGWALRASLRARLAWAQQRMMLF